MNNPIGQRRKKSNFTMVSNGLLTDERLSWRAKGLLCYMLSRPDGWQIRHADLVKQAKDGKDAVTTAIKELEECRYLSKKQERSVGGKFAKWVWIYDDVPYADLPDADLPDAALPDADLPDAEKPDYNNTDFNNKEFKNTDNTNTESKKDIVVQDTTVVPVSSNDKNFLIDEIIRYLNLKANKNFKTTTKAYRKEISGRIVQGATLEDFKHVIDVKTSEWLNSEKMRNNLNPLTLFREGNFDRYLNQEIPKQKEKTLRDIALEGNVDLAGFLRGES